MTTTEYEKLNLGCVAIQCQNLWRKVELSFYLHIVPPQKEGQRKILKFSEQIYCLVCLGIDSFNVPKF